MEGPFACSTGRRAHGTALHMSLCTYFTRTRGPHTGQQVRVSLNITKLNKFSALASTDRWGLGNVVCFVCVKCAALQHRSLLTWPLRIRHENLAAVSCTRAQWRERALVSRHSAEQSCVSSAFSVCTFDAPQPQHLIRLPLFYHKYHTIAGGADPVHARDPTQGSCSPVSSTPDPGRVHTGQQSSMASRSTAWQLSPGGSL